MRYLLFFILTIIINAQSLKTKLDDFKSPNEAIIYLNSLPKEIQNRYDLLILRTQAYTAIEDFDNALLSAQKLQNIYPKSIEAKEMVANILFWQKKFDESLAILKKLLLITKKSYYSKRIEIIQNAKLEYLKNSSKTNSEVNNTQIQTKKNFVEIGIEKFSFSDNRYNETREYLQAVFPISQFDVFAGFDNVSRYNMNDKNIRSEIYTKFEDKKWGCLTLSTSPTHNFMPKFSIGGHIYKGLDEVELGFGYDFYQYKNNNVNIVTPEYMYEFEDGWYINQKLYYVLDNKSIALSNEIGKNIPNKYKYAFLYTYGNSNEQLENLNIIENTIMHQIVFSGEYRLDANWGIGTSISFEHYKERHNSNNFNKKGGNFTIRRYW